MTERMRVAPSCVPLTNAATPRRPPRRSSSPAAAPALPSQVPLRWHGRDRSPSRCPPWPPTDLPRPILGPPQPGRTMARREAWPECERGIGRPRPGRGVPERPGRPRSPRLRSPAPEQHPHDERTGRPRRASHVRKLSGRGSWPQGISRCAAHHRSTQGHGRGTGGITEGFPWQRSTPAIRSSSTPRSMPRSPDRPRGRTSRWAPLDAAEQHPPPGDWHGAPPHLAGIP